ncbi:MAG: 50S ribosomal protein L27 [Candidatus Magasanikbacteria bacterium]
MAEKKAIGAAGANKDSNAQYRGLKVGDQETVNAGEILVRQLGTKIHPGDNVGKGKDDTLYAETKGVVKFFSKEKEKFDGSLKKTNFVKVVPQT